jgi:hypothetical protein
MVGEKSRVLYQPDLFDYSEDAPEKKKPRDKIWEGFPYGEY